MNLFCDEWTGSLDAAQQAELSIQRMDVKMKRKEAIVGIVATPAWGSSASHSYADLLSFSLVEMLLIAFYFLYICVCFSCASRIRSFLASFCKNTVYIRP